MKLPVYPEKTEIYTLGMAIEGKPTSNIGVGRDETHHFYFLCPLCGDKCVVVSIKATEYRRLPELYFDLFCPQCRITGQRKIWLGDTPWRPE